MSNNSISESLSIEQWLDVIGYEGIYQVSNHGRLKRVRGNNNKRIDRIVKGSPNTDGYVKVRLCNNGERDFGLHQLVITAFVSPSPFEGAEVNHINGIPSDNRLENLEWVTHSQNQIHQWRVLGGRSTNNSGERNGSSTKLKTEQVLEIRRLYKEGVRVGQLARMYGVKQPTISNIIARTTWKHI